MHMRIIILKYTDADMFIINKFMLKGRAKCQWIKERNLMKITFEKREMTIF
jgi:hypothetical protein